ncbi:MAG: LysM peptidoglycan-binding domain-containing protein [Lachnospiraceae bacterium]|nr:LysM peptidoglycan-binding domain-containing protein [Lachnospiraceae bacterium]
MYTFFYKTREGDSISSLAEKFNIPVDVLLATNGWDKGTEISVGEWIIITSDIMPTPKFYKVVSHDSLHSIAVKFNTTIDDLIEINELSNPDIIYPGQVLKIL